MILEGKEEFIGQIERAVERCGGYEDVDDQPLAWAEIAAVQLACCTEMLCRMNQQQMTVGSFRFRATANAGRCTGRLRQSTLDASRLTVT